MKIKLYIKLFYIFSGMCFSFLVSFKLPDYAIIPSLVLSLLIHIYFAFFVIHKYIHFTSLKYSIFAGVLSIGTIYYNFIRYNDQMPLIHNFYEFYLSNYVYIKIFSFLLCILSLYSVFIFFYYLIESFLSTIIKLIFDSKYIKVISFITVVYFIILTIIYAKTSVFYNTNLPFDIIFTADCSVHLKAFDNSFLQFGAIENDLRQPLFALFSLPFSLFSILISKILFFIPNSYQVCLMTMQIFLLQFSYSLLANLMHLKYKDGIIFILLINLTFPSLLFSLMIEQYIFTFFWLVLFIYSFINGFNDFFVNMLFIASFSGGLLTSFVLFPLFFLRDKNIKKFFQRICCIFIATLILIILSGQLYVILDSFIMLEKYYSWSGMNTPFIDIIRQFSVFIKTVFIQPNIVVAMNRGIFTYRLIEPTTVDLLGILFLILSCVGYFINKKDLFTNICFYWIAFSSFLLVCIGWGSNENGMILYTLYFSWAYLCLMRNFFIHLFKKDALFYLLIFAFLYNLTGIAQLIQFGINYYPK